MKPLGAVKSRIWSNDFLYRTIVSCKRFVRLFVKSKKQRYSEALTHLFLNVSQGSLVVSLPSFSGSFEFSAKSHILHRILIDQDYEPSLVSIVKEHLDPGRDVLDVGANVGLFTVLLSGLLSSGRKVLAVEPTPIAARQLRNNLKLNARNNVLVFEGVVSATSGERTINTIQGMEEYSSLGALVHPAIKGTPYTSLSVRSATVDELVKEYGLCPGFMKIDTEGTEYEVLSGATETMAKYRPVITLEAWPEELVSRTDSHAESLEDLFESHNYSISRCGRDQILAVPRAFSSSAKGWALRGRAGKQVLLDYSVCLALGTLLPVGPGLFGAGGGVFRVWQLS